MIKSQIVGISLIALFGTCSISSEQMENSGVSARTVPEQGQFDFWVGDWELTWNDTSKGSNVIAVMLDSMVIHEHFNGAPGNNLVGESVSTYNIGTGLWQQTWVDNQGSYLDFTGKFEDGMMILSRSFIAQNGTPVMQRMVWREITDRSFEWDWQGSRDDGETWNTNWQVSYKRKM